MKKKIWAQVKWRWKFTEYLLKVVIKGCVSPGGCQRSGLERRAASFYISWMERPHGRRSKNKIHNKKHQFLIKRWLWYDDKKDISMQWCMRTKICHNIKIAHVNPNVNNNTNNPKKTKQKK